MVTRRPAGGAATGLSVTTLSIIGGAAVGGTLATVKAVGDPASDWARYQGPFNMDVVENIVNTRNGAVVGACFWRISIAGTVTADVRAPAGGTLDADTEVNWTETETSRTCSSPQPVYSDSWRQSLSGPAGSLQLNRSWSGPGGNGGGTVTRTMAFTGALVGDAITGTLTLSFSYSGIAPNGDAVSQTYPATNAAVTLQKQ